MPILGAPPSYLQSTLPPGWTFGYQRANIGPVTWGMVDAYQVEWHMETLDGWEDSADTVQVTAKRPDTHGVFVGPQVYDARMATLTGWIIAPSYDAREAAADRLRTALRIGAMLDVVVTGRPDKTALGRRQGPLKLRPVTDTAFQVQFSLLFPDPLRYALPADALTLVVPSTTGGINLPTTLPVALAAAVGGGSTQAVNAGDMPAPWTARVPGPCSAPVLTNTTTGRSLTIDITLSETEWLDLDSREQTVLLGGVADRSGLIMVGSSWWRLEPGANNITYNVGPGAAAPGSASFTPTSAWS